jgi:two-component system, OmpR family, sensor histidine kinase MprB
VSLRARLTLAVALAVAAAVAIACGVVYVIVRGDLRGQVDLTLRNRAEAAHAAFNGPHGGLIRGPGGGFFARLPSLGEGGGDTLVQLVQANGDILRAPYSPIAIPVDRQTKLVAGGNRDAYLADSTVGGVHVRVLTAPLGQGLAVQVLRPLQEVDHTLSRLALWMTLVAASGIALAVAAGAVVSRAALAPVRRLGNATEEVARTHDLSLRVDVAGQDELSRLAASFNEMLEALEQSVGAQRQLVADASHELRTPLTSLRTNIEVLARGDGPGGARREQLLQDLTEQLEEMSALVNDLVELARENAQQPEPEELRLDLLVADAIERAQRRAPQVTIEPALDESTVLGVPPALERAVGNLLDNAVKWSPAGGVIEVTVSGGEVTVRDHGRGIDEADLPLVFDRFYRAPSARGMPGSGLGLAIVKQVAEQHGGSVSAEAAAGGGALLRLTLSGS